MWYSLAGDISTATIKVDYYMHKLFLLSLGLVGGGGSLVCNPTIYFLSIDNNGYVYTNLVSGSSVTVQSATFDLTTKILTITLSKNARYALKEIF